VLSTTIEGEIEIATQPRAIDHETNYTGSEDRLVPVVICHDVAHPRDSLDGTSRAERRGGFPALD
jgi:hypothetical protein